MPFDNACPSLELLRRSLDPDDLMTDDERQQIGAHVEGCQRGCKQAIADLLLANTVAFDPAATRSWAAPAASAPAPEALPTVPGYDVLRVLGRGGMGVVYQARQVSLKRLVALKMVLAGTHASDADRRRFRTEGEAVAALQHPNIVQIHEIGEQGGCPYFSLEYVEGGSLDHKAAKGTLPFADAARLVETLARAMHYCHQHGIVHRDLKPANVLLTSEGAPKITDFGLAKQLTDDLQQTRSGAIMGTPCYMAPEQAAGQVRAIGPAADVYALGAILYELLTGQPPFRGASMAVILEKVRAQEPVPPSRLRSRVPRDLETICLKCLAKEPGRRYGSALTLAQDLERFQAGEAILARREWLARKVWRKLRRHRVAVACVMLALMVASAIAIAAVSRTRTATKQRDEIARTIEASLAEPELTPAYLQRLVAHVAELEAQDADRAALARQKMRKELEAFIRSRLGQSTVPPEEFERIKAFLDDLARLQWDVEPLRRELKERRADWEPVFDLRPSSGPRDAFEAGQVTVADGALSARSPAASSNLGNAVFSLKSCAGNVKLAADFPEGWDAASELGLSFAGAPGHTEPITALVFHPDGRTLVSASGGKDRWGEVRFWNLAAIEERAAYRADRPGSLSVAVARDGRVAVANSNDPLVRLLDPTTGLVLASFAAHETGVGAVAFSSDGKTLATGGGVADKAGEIRIWDAATRERRSTLSGHADIIERLEFSADDRRLVSGAHDRTVILWDLAKRQPLVTTFPCHKEVPPWPRFTPGGKTLLATARPDKDSDWILGMQLMEWDLSDATRNYRPQPRIGGPASVAALACSPDGQLVAAASFWGECDVHIDRAAGSNPRGLDVLLGKSPAFNAPFFLRGKLPGRDRRFTVLEFSPDSSALLTGGSDGSVEMWDLVTGKLRAAFRGEGYSFVLGSPIVDADAPQKPSARPSMRAVREAGGSLTVQILRNTTRLREETLPATRIADGPLRLAARREGNRLTFQVNQLAAIEFEDVVPLRSATRSVFGLTWPAGVRLVHLHALQQALPKAASSLERGDDLYARGSYAEALVRYREQILAAGSGEAGHEARVKAALCQEHLEQPREAAALLEYVVTNGGQRWALIAACNLLRLQVDQSNLEAADTVLKILDARFHNVDFHTIIPDDFGERIVAKCNLDRLGLYLVPAPGPLLHNVKRARKVLDIFGSPAAVHQRVLLNLVLASHLAGQTDNALEAAQELLDNEGIWKGCGKDTGKGVGAFAELMEHYCWLQRSRGQAAVALARLDKELFPSPGVPNAALVFLFLPRARLHIALGQWQRAEQDLDDYFRLSPDGGGIYHDVPRAGLLLGFLRERRGDAAGAVDAWRRGMYSTWAGARNPAGGGLLLPTAAELIPTYVQALMVAALAGALSDAEAETQHFNLLARAEGKIPRVVFQEGARLVPRTLPRDMWLTPRGRDCARHLAFQDVSFAEFLRLPWLLATAESIHQAILPGELSADQDQVLWQLVSELHTAYTTGKVSVFQMGSLLLTWKGTTGLLGWQGVAPGLPDPLRGPLAYVFGRRYQQLNKPKESEAFYRAALKDAAADSPLRRLAQGVLDRKDYEKPLVSPRDAQEAAKEASDRGFDFFKEKEYDKAIAAHTEAIRFDGKAWLSYLGRGLAYAAKKEHDKAIADYGEAIRLKPTEALIYELRAKVFTAAAQHDKAIADCNEALRFNPKNAETYLQRGLAYSAKQAWDQAVADFSEAIRLGPKQSLPYVGRGVAYTAKKAFDQAIADYSEAIRLDPKDPQTYRRRGLIYLDKQDNDKAIADYNEAIQLDPKDPSAHFYRGVAYSSKREYDRAIADYTESIRLDPKNSIGYEIRGVTYSYLKEYDKAIADFSEAILLNPKRADAYRGRANARTAKKEHDMAIADYSEAIRLDPKDSFAYGGRARTYQVKQEYEKAIADYSEAARLAPNDADHANNLAWLLATCPKDGLRDGKKALEYATKACAMAKKAIYLDTLAAAHAECGNFQEAVKCQKQALDVGYDSKEAQEAARQRLKLYEEGKR